MNTFFPTRLTLRSIFVRACYWLAFVPPFRSALYSRAIAPRWPFQQSLKQMNALGRLLLSRTSVTGTYVEVGCAEGWTTIFLHRVMSESGQSRRMFAVDTFAGFTSEDIKGEEARGKSPRMYDGAFTVNSKRWFDESMRRAGVPVSAYQADAATFDYARVGPIAFCFLDVDLYHPMREALQRVLPHMAKGGVIVVDDCQTHDKWDGALEAYAEWCREHQRPIEIVAEKFGIINV